jgi:glutamine synthetase
MAKPFTADAGSSCHIHLSLWNSDGDRNVFDDKGERSDVFRWFLGGWMAHVRDFMVCYAPTVNSYKRFQEASWAPTRLAWSDDNRTAGFRVVGQGSSLRIECRIPGADCNPYLAYAAALASGLDGVEQRTEPPSKFDGDVYSAADLPRVPATLEEALSHFTSSEIAARTLGSDVVEHYGRFVQTEVDAFHTAVTDWERTRYFEQI